MKIETKKKDVRTQYDSYARDFSMNQEEKNQINRAVMYDFVDKDLLGKNVLDLCCGDGTDVNYYKSLGANVCGVDASFELIDIAKKKYPSNEFKVSFAEDLPYADCVFDSIYSKYAIMTSEDMKPIFSEVYRVLKPGGKFIYLVTHPLRQFMERKKLSEDYFNQRQVNSHILDNSVTVVEPTHTFNEYFNKEIFMRFEMLDFKEVFDPAAEQVHGGCYPGFFIVSLRKK